MPLTYMAPITIRPRKFTYDPPAGASRSNSVTDIHVMPVVSVRPLERDVSLHLEGFALLYQENVMQDFYDDDEVRRLYYAGTERVLAEATGAKRVFVFDHTVRRRVQGAVDRVPRMPRQPAARIHVDHTVKSEPQCVRDYLSVEAVDLLRWRLQVINL